MAKCRIFYTEYPENPPEWYWESGLHDASIIGVETYEFPFDYGKYTAEKNKYDHNMLSLRIDAKGALYDSRVKEIQFYNYKLLPESVDLASLEPSEKNKVWWLADQLTEQNGKFELDILLEICVPHQKQFHLKIRFDRAEVDRK
jgi:hypothetical protein